MHGLGVFYQAFVYLLAAVVSVPVAKRLGFGSVLGYLAAGVLIGPFILGLVGAEGRDVMHFAEFGVVMMLFLVGLELRPSLLWRLRTPIVGMGGLQVGLTATAMAVVAVGVGLTWPVALAVGLVLSLSSTAMVLQTLEEKGLFKTDAGQRSFAILLFQDIAVIPMLALMPLLATSGGEQVASATQATDHGSGWMQGLPGWVQAVALLGAMAAIVVGGRFAIVPLFRFIAGTRLREIFTAAALLLVVGIALLMATVGLSPALGTFLAGVVLADSEYRHELESDIAPFKGLLLGLFFIAVGASIDFDLIIGRPGLILGLVALLVSIKLIVLAVLGRVFRMGLDQNLLMSLALAQGGEFGFVLLSFATQQSVLAVQVSSPLTAVIALSMALTPLLLLVNERLVQPRFGTHAVQRQPPDTIDEQHHVIMAGFGRVGSVVGRLLSANGFRATVLDNDSDHVDTIRKFGFKVFYGDASRPDLLKAAGADQAKLLIIAIDDPERSLQIIETCRKHFPRLPLLVRAAGRTDAYTLIEAGVQHVYRETFDTALRMGTDALHLLGHRANQAHRAARTFRVQDEAYLRELVVMRHDTKAYLRRARQQIQDLEQLLKTELDHQEQHVDAAWDTTSLQEEAATSEGEQR